MWRAGAQRRMDPMLMTGSATIDAEQAFRRAARARRRAAIWNRLRGNPAGRLPVLDGRIRPGRPERGIREIPLRAIAGTLEPGKASLFDCAFRPGRAARGRWQRVWLAEHRGQTLPPISVARVDGGYVLLDGHHRVSVAKARGAATIDASVDTP
jgi:hypothetical protein